MSSAQRILVIEDNATLRDIILQILEIENFEAILAVDGEEGLRLARERVPDLILCDIAMPKMTGYEVLRAVRGDAALRGIPFIFLTAKAERSDLRAGMDLGADDYLTKPFDAEELLAAVRTRLKKHESVITAAQQATDRRQSELMLSLPHEVRTPLSGILGLAELLSESDFSPEERRSMVNDILASGRRLERTLTNLLLHQELELARQSPERAKDFYARAPEPVNRSLQAAAASKLTEYGRPVTLTIAPETLSAYIDPRYLQKAVEELLDNALRFSALNALVEVMATQAGRHALITISDHGPGMTTEQIAQAQDRQFNRAQRLGQGLGLGLAIARNLVELNQGSLTINDNPGGGLIVTLRLLAEEAS